MARIISKKARPTHWRYMGRPRNVANGVVSPFAAIEAARAHLGLGKQDPHFAHNKTIPYRFILFNDAFGVKLRSHGIVSGRGAAEWFLWGWTERGSMARAHRPGTA